MTTLFDALSAQTRRMGDQPAVVFADAGTGERTELGFRTLHNWVSKTANLLLDTCDVTLGSEVTIDSTLHWMVPVVVFGTWATGAAVRVPDVIGATPDHRILVGHEGDGPRPSSDTADVLIGTGIGGRPVDTPLGDVLTVRDILAEPDEFISDPGDEGAWAIGGRTQATLLGEAAAPGDGERVLHAGDRTTEQTVFTLARTLVSGIGVVLARGYDAEGLDRLARQERV